MARSSIGLDIGTRAVRLAEVSGAGDHVTVNRFGRLLLPAGAVEHGDIKDPQAVGNAIATLWKRLGLSGKSVHVGMANRRVVVRVIELPAMSAEDRAGALRFQAQDHIPIPLDQAFMDHEVIEEFDGPNGRMQRILVVAAERGTVENLVAAVQAARLEPVSLELNAYPLVRAFTNGSSAAQAIVDIGAGVTNVVIAQNGRIRFTRIIPNLGGDEFTAAVAATLSISGEEAERVKREATVPAAEQMHAPVAPVIETPAVVPVAASIEESLQAPERVVIPMHEAVVMPVAVGGSDHAPMPIAPIAPTPMRSPMPVMPSINGNGASYDAPAPVVLSPAERAGEAMVPVMERLVAEVRSSIDFYASQPGALNIERVILTGGSSQLSGIADRLRDALGVSVEPGRPFQRVPVGKVKVTQQDVAVAEPFMAVALGLALAGGN